MNKYNHHRKQTKRLVLSPIKTIGHYFLALVPMMIPGIELYVKLNHIRGGNSFSNTILLICFIISGIIILLKRKELKIERIYESRTNVQFKEAVLATANELNWQIEETTDKKIIASSVDFWKSMERTKITISKTDNYVEISSIFEPFLSFLDIFGINKKNRNTFLNYYLISNQLSNLNEKVIQQIRDEAERKESEPEWNLINTLKRVAIYLVSLFFWVIAIGLWKFDGFSLFVPIFAILGSVYLVIDIYVLLTKKKTPAHNNT